eukprot:CAMPEP_0177565228 /NCGR_PEP_ID=MMETSP0369-20130122/74033_1 /TAXON_ID=447022 ORGANISM="Scrippsiella hangoei-like, Strain SHHI-4" /NCGR_SAMPLE_ID=MMETSP0369 /ASSEMBLY_ACC=CAM_ASM_000364 /LENGTH=77 /DNA_ID=CAMNT_0019052561 /DNA_START=14 /DNA_END=244 /DNA_ORIENTATION=+
MEEACADAGATVDEGASETSSAAAPPVGEGTAKKSNGPDDLHEQCGWLAAVGPALSAKAVLKLGDAARPTFMADAVG